MDRVGDFGGIHPTAGFELSRGASPFVGGLDEVRVVRGIVSADRLRLDVALARDLEVTVGPATPTLEGGGRG